MLPAPGNDHRPRSGQQVHRLRADGEPRHVLIDRKPVPCGPTEWGADMTTPLTREDLAAVRPDTLASYLTARGWHVSDDVPHGEIWEPSSGDGWVFLPREPGLGDYANRVADVLRVLA